MSENRKRLNCYVDVETYDRLKRILDLMGMTVTDFINQSMADFIDNMEQIVLSKDKDAFLQMMAKNIDVIQEQVAQELKK